MTHECAAPCGRTVRVSCCKQHRPRGSFWPLSCEQRWFALLSGRDIRSQDSGIALLPVKGRGHGLRWASCLPARSAAHLLAPLLHRQKGMVGPGCLKGPFSSSSCELAAPGGKAPYGGRPLVLKFRFTWRFWTSAPCPASRGADTAQLWTPDPGSELLDSPKRLGVGGSGQAAPTAC